MCNTWLHSGCAGLSKSAFQLVSTTSEPFYCSHCALSSQRKEIVAFKPSVDQLFSKEIVFLKSIISQLTSEMSSLKEKLATVAPHNSINFHPLQNWSKDPANPPAVTPQQNTPTQHTSVSHHRFNVVISGISELPKGSSCTLKQCLPSFLKLKPTPIICVLFGIVVALADMTKQNLAHILLS